MSNQHSILTEIAHCLILAQIERQNKTSTKSSATYQGEQDKVEVKSTSPTKSDVIMKDNRK